MEKGEAKVPVVNMCWYIYNGEKYLVKQRLFWVDFVFCYIFSLFFHMGYGNGDESDGGSPWIEKARVNMNRNASNGRDRN